MYQTRCVTAHFQHAVQIRRNAAVAMIVLLIIGYVAVELLLWFRLVRLRESPNYRVSRARGEEAPVGQRRQFHHRANITQRFASSRTPSFPCTVFSICAALAFCPA